MGNNIHYSLLGPTTTTYSLSVIYDPFLNAFLTPFIYWCTYIVHIIIYESFYNHRGCFSRCRLDLYLQRDAHNARSKYALQPTTS